MRPIMCRSLRGGTRVPWILAGALLLLIPSIAQAARFASQINCTNRDLSDLNTIIQANFGSDKGGFKQDSTGSETPGNRSTQCAAMQILSNAPRTCKYINGYDQLRAYLMFDFLNSDGLYHRQTNLYAGWEVSGIIGDANGDGNPNSAAALNNHDPCGQSAPDLAGIDGADDYSVLLFQCSTEPGVPGDQIVEVRITSNGILVNSPITGVLYLQQNSDPPLINGLPAGVTFTFAPDEDLSSSSHTINPGHTLKLCVTNLELLLDAATGQTNVPINGLLAKIHSGNASNNVSLTNEESCPMQLLVPNQIAVTKTADSPTVCPGSDASFTIHISNPGDLPLSHIEADDVLNNGMTFKSSVPPPTGPGLHWVFDPVDLKKGDTPIEIKLVATAPSVCAGDLRNDVSVLGRNVCPDIIPDAHNSDFATVRCIKPDITPSATDIDCGTPQGTTHVTVNNPGDAPCGASCITYEWTGTGMVGPGNEPDATWSASGTKTIKVCFLASAGAPPDQGCCTTRTVTVNDNRVQPTCSIDNPGMPDCNTTGHTLTAHASSTSSMASLTYSWSDAGSGPGWALIPPLDGLTVQYTAGDPNTQGKFVFTVTDHHSSDPLCQNSCPITVTCGTQPPKLCWFTGGGQSTDGTGDLHSYGGVIYPGCSPIHAGGGNWNDLNHNTGVHLKGLTMHVEKCDNLPAPFPPGSSSPKTGVNYIEFNGHGYVTGLNNGNKRTDVVFWGHYEDRHEPGNTQSQPNVDLRDRYFFVAFAGSTPVVVISDDGSTDTTTSNALAHAVIITHGNMQIHQTGCDKVPKPGQLELPDVPGIAVSPLPTELSFGLPRPNPTGTSMTMQYSLPKAALLSAKVFDVAGRVVRDLGDGPVGAGWHMLSWDLQDDSGQRVGPGLYFVRFSLDGQVQMRHVTVLQ